MKEKSFLSELIRLRRKIHQYPEMGHKEFKTAKLIESTLKSWAIPYKRVAGTGVMGTIKGAESSSVKGKCVALRADMDALPLREQNQHGYLSKHPGIMHACGHDAHVTMLLGAAKLLSQSREFSGTVKLLFQPNEEGAGGAKSLIQKGVMKNPQVHGTFGLHVNPRLPSGKIGLKAGPLMASVDKFTLEIVGKGGHAAYPHEGKDAISIASEIVQSLQTIVSRKLDPIEPAVLTIGTIQGGQRFNILAEKVILTGTVRTLSEKVHRDIPRMIRQVCDGLCRAHGGSYHLQYDRIGSVLSNTKSMIELSRKVAVKNFGEKSVMDLESASMGGEDFPEYLKHSPGCFIYIGTGNKSKKTDYPWHHPKFNIDETAMPVGARLLAEISKKFLKN